MRKEVRARALVRRGPKREPYDKVLIVCEGKKTEPNYLEMLSANVEVVGFPVAIRKKRGDPFDKVFCVFDKDQHTDYRKPNIKRF